MGHFTPPCCTFFLHSTLLYSLVFQALDPSSLVLLHAAHKAVPAMCSRALTHTHKSSCAHSTIHTLLSQHTTHKYVPSHHTCMNTPHFRIHKFHHNIHTITTYTCIQTQQYNIHTLHQNMHTGKYTRQRDSKGFIKHAVL